MGEGAPGVECAETPALSAGEAQAAFDKKQRMQDVAIKRSFKAGEADIDPETRKQLEALGYFGE